MNEETKLKPCPFCGGTSDDKEWPVYLSVAGEPDEHPRVRCPGCSAAGPLGVSDVDAIDEWNNRAPANEHKP